MNDTETMSILEATNPELVAALRRRLNAAVLAEHNRCAKIAEQWAQSHGCHIILRNLARQIREGVANA